MPHTQEPHPPYTLFHGDALRVYHTWDTPEVIISDGAYGLKGFPGDPATPTQLGQWYEPHIQAWTRHATPTTTLWFWNTEIGWAHTHPTFEKYGWKYVQTVVWNKGIGHVAGNVNSKTIRQFPVVTEIAALYEREPGVYSPNGNEDNTGMFISLQTWLREEWKRTGLPLNEANVACGVKNVATRKYLTQDNKWYMPPWEQMEKLITYANTHGNPEGKPYFAMPQRHISQQQVQCSVTQQVWETQREVWSQMKWEGNRRVWNHTHGLTNVWSEPSLRGEERLKTVNLTCKGKFAHANQKPLKLLQQQIIASTNRGGIVWEPFAGTATASLAALLEGRQPYAAEINKEYYQTAKTRLTQFVKTYNMKP